MCRYGNRYGSRMELEYKSFAGKAIWRSELYRMAAFLSRGCATLRIAHLGGEYGYDLNVNKLAKLKFMKYMQNWTLLNTNNYTNSKRKY